MHPAVAACEGVIVQSQSESESESQAAVTQRRVTTVWAAEWPSCCCCCCCLLLLQVHLCVLHFSLMTFYLFLPLSPGLCGCQNCAYAMLPLLVGIKLFVCLSASNLFLLLGHFYAIGSGNCAHCFLCQFNMQATSDGTFHSQCQLCFCCSVWWSRNPT